jgi:hypothetical protein
MEPQAMVRQSSRHGRFPVGPTVRTPTALNDVARDDSGTDGNNVLHHSVPLHAFPSEGRPVLAADLLLEAKTRTVSQDWIA